MREATFRAHDAPGSTSNSAWHFGAMMLLCRRMLACRPPLKVRHRIWEKIGGHLHGESDQFLRGEDLCKAWGRHIRSVLYVGGWRYPGYTRWLLKFPQGTRE